MSIRPIPINPAEAIFEPFWDPLISPLPRWRCDADPGTGGKVSSFWFGVMIQWDRGDGKVVARMTRDADWNIDGYDRLHLCLTLASTIRLSVSAVIDGRARTLITDAPGANDFAEYEGAIDGRRMEHIELILRDTGPGPGQGRIMWLGVFNEARRQAVRSAPNPYEHALDGLMLPPDQVVEAAPTLGLFIDKSDLDELRRKATSPAYAPLVEQLRHTARAGLKLQPWRGIGRFPNEGGPRGSRGGTGGHIDPLVMRLGSLIGLIDNDPALLRMALSHALAMAHCECWFPDFLEAFPGSSFEQRAFFDYRYGTNVVFAWDWAGAYLTRAGKTLLAHAVSTRALPRIHATLMRHDYVRQCNQGAYMSYGAIVCTAALMKVWNHAGDFLAPPRRALDETMNSYLAPDGGAFEGMGYVSATIGHALVAYQLIARLERKPLREVVPERVLRSVDYLTTMLSTAPPAGSGINVADGGRPGSTLYPECLPFLAQLCGDASSLAHSLHERGQGEGSALASTTSSAISALLAAMLRQPFNMENFGVPGAAFIVLFGPPPESLPAPAVHPPVFHVLPHTGQLCSCRPTPDGPVRIQIIGAPAGAGHAHEDKGSFVIEAFGEEIAIDRGQMPYSDPRCGIIKAARYHNLLIPLDAQGEPMAQINPCPVAVLPRGTGDEINLDATVDANAVWGPRVRRWLRHFQSATPTVIDVIDEMDQVETTGEAERAVGFYIHSRFPWTHDAVRGGWVTRGRRAELLVTPEWSPASVSAGEDFVDGTKAPAYTLVLRSAPSVRHRFRTRLTVSPVKTS